MRKTWRRDREGFTLIELLIVMVILGILATAAAVSYTKARQDALEKEATGYLQMLRQAAKYYYEDTGGYPTSIFQTPSAKMPPKANPSSNWAYGYTTPASPGAWAPPTAYQKLSGAFPSPTPTISMNAAGTTTKSSTGNAAVELADEP